jgi:hypothetical protein
MTALAEQEEITERIKIHYLITAYSNQKHLTSLIESLKTRKAQVRFFVHYDKKSATPDKRADGDVVFIDSIPVWWAGWSHQQAIINLSEKSVSEGADWHILLSGSDYPIRSNTDIILELQKGLEVITLRKGFFTDKPKERLEYYHFDGFDRRTKTLKTLFYLTIEHLLKQFHKRRIPLENVYHGTTWWALSQECLSYALKQIREKRELVDFYKHSFCAEESLFHTIIGNSQFRSRARKAWVYQDWDVNPGPGPITMANIRSVREQNQNEFFFARKFSESSRDIVEYINTFRSVSDVPDSNDMLSSPAEVTPLAHRFALGRGFVARRPRE